MKNFELDLEVVKMLPIHNISLDQIKSAIQQNKHNDITTTYYLL